jgi:hypothetical protein
MHTDLGIAACETVERVVGVGVHRTVLEQGNSSGKSELVIGIYTVDVSVVIRGKRLPAGVGGLVTVVGQVVVQPLSLRLVFRAFSPLFRVTYSAITCDWQFASAIIPPSAIFWLDSWLPIITAADTVWGVDG